MARQTVFPERVAGWSEGRKINEKQMAYSLSGGDTSNLRKKLASITDPWDAWVACAAVMDDHYQNLLKSRDKGG